MVIFNHADSDVLGTVTIGNQRYQMRKSDSAEPDVYHWRGLSNNKQGWYQLKGYQFTKRIAEVRTEWYRAGGLNEKAKL